MPIKRSLCLILVLVASVVAAPAVDAAQPRRVRDLRAVNTIVGDETTMMRVRLPEDVVFNYELEGEYPAISISGGGRFAGVLLTKANVEDVSRSSVLAGRVGFCERRGCEPGGGESLMFTRASGPGDAGERILDAGDYLLYLIADDTAVEVVLRLDGLRGRQTLRPSGAASYGLGAPPVKMSGEPARATYWDGQSVDFSGRAAIVVSMLSVEVDHWVGGKLGSCIYRGEPVAPDPIAYGPRCPGGGNDVGVTYVSPGAMTRAVMVTPWMVSTGGTWSYGSYYWGAATVKDVDGLHLHIDLS